MNKKLNIFFFTGVSGSGKTYLIDTLKNAMTYPDLLFYHFDSIGIPSEAEMIAQYGSGTNWQKATTLLWVEKSIKNAEKGKTVFIEGSVHFFCIEEAFAFHHFSNYKIVLVHCATATRHQRLSEQRLQPELVNEQMDTWSEHLKKQAVEKDILILDTTQKTTQEIIDWCTINLSL